MKTTKIAGLFILVIVVFLSVPLFNQRGPDRFSFDRVATDFSGTSPLVEDVDSARNVLWSLAKDGKITFEYLGHGSQGVAFEGKDHPYILKLLLTRSISGKKGRFPSLWRLIPSYRKEREKKIELRKQQHLQTSLNAYEIAFQYLKEDAGLIAIHLHPTKNLFPRCSVKDRLRKLHEIDLDRAVFILQEKAELVTDRFARLTTREEYEASVRAMDALFESHTRKGVSDFNDRFKIENYGFLGDRAIFLDPGRAAFSEDVLKNPQPEMERLKHNLRCRLSWEFPCPSGH